MAHLTTTIIIAYLKYLPSFKSLLFYIITTMKGQCYLFFWIFGQLSPFLKE